MALGKLGSLVTTDANPVGIFTATNSQTVTVYVNNQNNSSTKYSIGVSTNASTIQSSEYVNRYNDIGPLEVVEVEKLYIDANQTLVVQSNIAGVSFAAIAVGSGTTTGTGYGRTDTVITTASNKGTNLTLSTPSEDVVYTIGINNQSYDNGKIYVGVADSAGNLDNGWIIFAQTIPPSGNFSIRDLYVADSQRVIVKASIADVSFTTLASPTSAGGGGGGGGPSSLNATLGVGNTSDLGMSVGVVTATKVKVGTTTFTEDLVVGGNARITGILTVGTSSVVIDGTENQVNVGAGVTIHHTNGILVGQNTLHSSGLTVNNLSVSGVLTGNVTGNATGLSGSPNLNVGVITATTFSGGAFIGDGSGLINITGVGGGVQIKDGGTLVGTAGTIDFGANLSVSVASGAAVTITGAASTVSVVQDSYAGVSPITYTGSVITIGSTSTAYGTRYISAASTPTTQGSNGDIWYYIGTT